MRIPTIYGRRRPSKRRSRARVPVHSNKAVVFVVPGSETYDGRHIVHYAKNGDLVHGDHKSFRNWEEAKRFGRAKHRELGGALTIHPY